jgi:hypothetical protein
MPFAVQNGRTAKPTYAVVTGKKRPWRLALMNVLYDIYTKLRKKREHHKHNYYKHINVT